MATEAKSNRWLWLLLLLLLLLWWRWSRKPAAAASSPGPGPQSQPATPPQVVVDTYTPPPTVEIAPGTGSNLSPYANLSYSALSPEFVEYLTAIEYVDPERVGREYNRRLWYAYEQAKASGDLAWLNRTEDAIHYALIVRAPNSYEADKKNPADWRTPAP